MAYPLRPIAPEQFRDFAATAERAFGEDLHDDEVERDLNVFEFERSLAAFDGNRIVATAGAFSLELTVPGTTVPAAGVTFVGVLPTHRRRGILTSIMERQLGEVHDAGREPIAALWASEASIYGRFGYGIAAHHALVSVPRATAALRPDAPSAGATLELGSPDEHRKELAAVHDAVRAERPGFFRRDERWWAVRLHDAERRRGGGSALCSLVASTAEGPVGYALYRTTPRWDEASVAGGTVDVVELVAGPAGSHADLWRALLHLDLMTCVRARVAPDDPLFALLANPRPAAPRLVDNLWVRLVDVGPGLAARRYATPVDLVLDVRDERCPWNAGRWRLSGDRSGATCEPTSDPADLTLPAEALGAAYLGGTTLASLAVAGRVDEATAGAVAAASAAFGWHRLPCCPLVF